MGSAASWQIQSQRKAQSGFLWFGVKFNPWRVLMGEGGGFLGLFFLPLWSYIPCRAQFLLGRVDKYSIRSNLDVYPHLSPSEAKRFGRSLLQWGTGKLTAEAEWASAEPGLINDANTGPRSDAWANRGDVSPSNRWQSPFSRAPQAAWASELVNEEQ